MRKITFFLTLMVAMVTTAMAQSYKLTATRLSSSDLNSKTEPTLIAIKNLSKTNSYWFVGNTAGVPYSAAEFSNDAVFVWEPVVEGVPGVAYSLKKLDGTYMTSTSPTTFAEDKNAAALFKTTNPTTSGSGETYFNGDGDTVYDDESLFVRFVTGGKWINVQNGDAGTPVYNNGEGGWTLHNVYLVEESDGTEQPTPEPEQPVVAPVADKAYTVVAEKHSKGGKPQWAISDVANEFVSSREEGVTVSTEEQKQFAFVEYEGLTYIYSVSAKQFVMKDATLSDKGDAVEITKLDNGKFFFRFDASHNINIGGSEQMIIDTWSTVDGGNQYTLVEVADFDPAEALAKLAPAPVEPELEALEATNATRNPAESDWDPSKSYYLQGVKLDFAEAVKKADGVTEFGCIYDANGEVVAVINKILGANGTAKYATPYVATKITTAGTYKVVVYPGVILSADGAKEYKGGEFEFVVAKKPATLIPSAEDGLFYNASFTSVEEFKTQQIIVSGADEVTVSEDVKITMTSGENVYTATVTVEDKDGNKVINIVFPDEDYAAGRYTINIPEGAFLVDGVANAEYYASNFTYKKPQLKVTKDWTSWEALFTEKYMMPREVAIAINNAEAVTVAEGMVATLAVGETTYNSTVSFTSEENNYWISFKFAEIEAIYENEDADFVKGEYTFTVPAGLYTVNGEANVEETRVFTYGDAVVEEFSVTSVSPAVGDVTELNRIEIAFSNNTKPEQLILTNGDERFFFIAKDGAYVAVDPLKDYAEITITELGTYTLDLSELDGLTGDKVFSWTVVEAVEEPVDYTPTYTGTVERYDRNVTAVTLGDNRYNLLTPEQSSCYVDATETVKFVVEAGATVKASVEHKGEWVHHALYIDIDADGFTSGIEEGSEWKPAGDLVTYAFYNNGGSSDEYGYNSVGTSMSGDDRHMPKMPEFVAPTEPGLYRIRFVQDWCSIDPNGDSDGKFGDFMGNGGQIIDVMLEVVEPITEGVDSVDAEAENAVIYDLTGRKIEKITKAGIYIINGVKKVVK